MHELGICDAMLKMVRGIMQEQEIDEVSRITVEVGSLSGVMPNFLADCWVAVTDGTDLPAISGIPDASASPDATELFPFLE